MISRKRAGGISPIEELELEGLLDQNPDYNFYTKFVDDFFALPNNRIAGSSYIDRHWDNFLKKSGIADSKQFSVGNKRIVRGKLWVAAACIAVLGLIFFLVFQRSGKVQENKESNNIIYTKKGAKSNIVLPDGTKIWVNSDTRLTYDKLFGDKERVLYLRGEAFFDVAHDPKRPFIVKTKTIDIRVKGTSFNVRAYDDETNAQATLLKGQIEVYLKRKNEEKIVLNPNQKIIVRTDGNEVFKGNTAHSDTTLVEIVKTGIGVNDSAFSEVQWMNDKLIFSDNDMDYIIRVLERWYNVRFVIKNERIKQMKFKGTFHNDSLEDVLESIKLVSGIDYKIVKNTVFMY